MLVRPVLVPYGHLRLMRHMVFQPKLDGHRMISRNGIAYTKRGAVPLHTIPELPPYAVLDGEAVGYDETGKPVHHNQIYTAPEVRYHAFDIMEIDGRDISHLPYRERLEILYTLPILTVPTYSSLSAIPHTGEGIIGRHPGHSYKSGKATAIKWRNPDYEWF